MKNWIFLSIAIVSEVIATSGLKASEGFTVLVPSIIVAVGYSSAFFFLSLTLRTIPVGMAYAIWSGVGVALITILGWIIFDVYVGCMSSTSVVMSGRPVALCINSGSMHRSAFISNWSALRLYVPKRILIFPKKSTVSLPVLFFLSNM